MQHIIFPWETSKWQSIQDRLETKITGVVDFDSRLSSLNFGKIRTREVSQLFAQYYDSEYSLPEEQIKLILQSIQQLVLDGPRTFREFKLNILVGSQNITLNRLQIATLIACMFFGLFNYNYISDVSSDKNKTNTANHINYSNYSINDFPEATLINLFTTQHVFGLHCIMNYFNFILNNTIKNNTKLSTEHIIFKRTVLSNTPNWSTSTQLLTEIFLCDTPTDDSPAKLKTVYTHEYIGDHMFKNAITQEEINLLIFPEALVSMLLCAKMSPFESITVIGVEKMTKYTSIGTSIKYLGNNWDNNDKVNNINNINNNIKQIHALVFIDASAKLSKNSQLEGEFDRDLNKAYCGFTSVDGPKYVSSGIWSFSKSHFTSSNNIQIKFIQLVLAASMAQKCLIYHQYDTSDKSFESSLIPFINFLTKLTISDLYNMYKNAIKPYLYNITRITDINIFNDILDNYTNK